MTRFRDKQEATNNLDKHEPDGFDSLSLRGSMSGGESLFSPRTARQTRFQPSLRLPPFHLQYRGTQTSPATLPHIDLPPWKAPS